MRLTTFSENNQSTTVPGRHDYVPPPIPPAQLTFPRIEKLCVKCGDRRNVTVNVSEVFWPQSGVL